MSEDKMKHKKPDSIQIWFLIVVQKETIAVFLSPSL